MPREAYVSRSVSIPVVHSRRGLDEVLYWKSAEEGNEHVPRQLTTEERKTYLEGWPVSTVLTRAQLEAARDA